jgi:hypothetical protein
MFRHIVVGLISLVASNAWAQQTPPQAKTSAVEPSKAAVTMETPMAGDHWTYEERDEITGKLTTRTKVITEITAAEISTRVDTLGNSTPGQIVFDRSWNDLSSGTWKYSPNSGLGIQLPLTVGKAWDFQCDEVSTIDGSLWKQFGRSKVVGQETVTTKAGTFETFKIETSYSAKKSSSTARAFDATLQTWYALAINHWVKKILISRTNKHLMINNTAELIDYGRKL